jgi:hypothetical protein
MGGRKKVVRWRWVVGFEGVYQVSDHGQVRSVDRILYRKRKTGIVAYRMKGKMLKIHTNGTGVTLPTDRYENRCQMTHSVSVLVCTAFNGKPTKNRPLCLHRDDDNSHNHYKNLYWGNFSDNLKDAWRNGKRPNPTWNTRRSA